MVGVLEGMAYIQQQGDAGRQRGTQSRLAQLASQAYGAPQAQQRGLVQQAIQADPQAGFALSKGLGDDRQQRIAGLSQQARMLVSYAKAGNRQGVDSLYPQIAAEAQAIGLGQGIPTTWDESFLPGMEQLANIGGGSATTGVQSTYVDAQGNRVAILRDGSTQVLGQNAPNNQIIDTGNGFYGVNKGNLQAAPVMVGGAPQPMPQQSGAPGGTLTAEDGSAIQTTQFRDANGRPINFDAAVPPEMRAAILAQPAQFDAAPNGAIANLPPVDRTPAQFGQGQQLRSTPKPAAPSEFERRMEAARAMGASEDELRRMVIGREGAAAGARPMPAAALRMVTDANSALKEVETVQGTLARIRQEIASEQLNLGPVSNLLNRGRTAVGMGNDESARFSTMMTSLRGLQNAALRLNKGVQTEGDAQRIWEELLGNLNDERSVLANIDRLIQLNERARELHEMNLETVNENYGRVGQQTADAPQPNAVQPSAGWGIQRVR